MQIKDFVKVYDNTVDPKFLKKFFQIKDYFLNPEKGRIGTNNNGAGSLNENIRKVGVHFAFSNLHNKTKTEKHWNNFFVYVHRMAVKKYLSEVSKLKFDMSCMDLCYLNYKESDHYAFHVDQSASDGRHLTALYMVNDGYEGGELLITDPLNHDNHITVTPKAGRITVFPSNFMFPHQVNPVTNGERLSIVTWWR